MTTPQWAPATLYQPGDLVRPLTGGAATPVAPNNADFESGDTGWGASHPGFTIEMNSGCFDGLWCVRYTAASGIMTNTKVVTVTPGQVITASCRIQIGGPSGDLGGHMELIFYSDAGTTEIAHAATNQGDNNIFTRGHWYQIGVVATVPAGATHMGLRLIGFRSSGTAPVYFDTVVWDYTYIPPASSDGVVYKATQAAAATSATSEPVWPVVGGSVVDGGVTWQGVYGTRIEWTAHPILKSGSVEPTWPSHVDATVSDNTISWKASTGRITDPKCPNSKVVAIAASKVFAADVDIIAFSATVNPLDWSTANDAGYLPFGLQSHGSTPAKAMGLYRSNLVVFNDEGYQMWQVDPDPANMAYLDGSPVGCSYHKSVQPVSNDLLFCTPIGIRSIGIAGASTNLQAGYFGAQVDPLVLAAINALPPGEEPISLFWPGAGQYWLIFGAEAFVLTMNGSTKDQSWSRYVFPAEITDWALLDGNLYIRAGALVWRVSDLATFDDQLDDTGAGGENVPFEGYMAWPYLDMGALGQDKMLEGFDLVINGTCTITMGYNQKLTNLATDPYTVDGDTLPGDMLPLPLTAPSFQLRLTFAADQSWEWMAANLYYDPL